MLEAELQRRLGMPTTPEPVREEWRRWSRRPVAVASKEQAASARAFERAREVAEAMAEPQGLYKEGVGREFTRTQKRNPRSLGEYTPNVRRFIPSPVTILFAFFGR